MKGILEFDTLLVLCTLGSVYTCGFVLNEEGGLKSRLAKVSESHNTSLLQELLVQVKPQ